MYIKDTDKLIKGIVLMGKENAKILFYHLEQAEMLRRKANFRKENGLNIPEDIKEKEKEHERKAFGKILYADKLQADAGSHQFAVRLGEKVSYKEYADLDDNKKLEVDVIVHDVTAEIHAALHVIAMTKSV